MSWPRQCIYSKESVTQNDTNAMLQFHYLCKHILNKIVCPFGGAPLKLAMSNF